MCFAKHLIDCGDIVIHILEEPLLGELLLGQGLCEGLDISLCEEVVVGLMTCGGEVLVFEPHAQGYLLLHLREDEGQEEVLEDKDEEEEESEVDEKVKEIREDAQLMHATWS